MNKIKSLDLSPLVLSLSIPELAPARLLKFRLFFLSVDWPVQLLQWQHYRDPRNLIKEI